jgi:hypothetical protein
MGGLHTHILVSFSQNLFPFSGGLVWGCYFQPNLGQLLIVIIRPILSTDRWSRIFILYLKNSRLASLRAKSVLVWAGSSTSTFLMQLSVSVLYTRVLSMWAWRRPGPRPNRCSTRIDKVRTGGYKSRENLDQFSLYTNNTSSGYCDDWRWV